MTQNLGIALDDMSVSLIEDHAAGVMAGVHYISGQIDASIPKTVSRPVKLEPLPGEMPPPEE